MHATVYVLSVVLVSIISIDGFPPNHGSNDANQNFDAHTFLEKYGYLDILRNRRQHESQSTSSGIRDFQRLNGLRVTGRLDRETVRKMQSPRCGLPDVIRPSDRVPHIQDDPNHPLKFYAPGYKWHKRDISYKVVGYTRQLRRRDQRRAFQRALRKWSQVTPLTFRLVRDGEADIDINFLRGFHGDGPANMFDGRGGTLAHAFFPGTQQISGDVHFDEEEQWTLEGTVGTNLEIQAAHEFGHALGLGHSNISGAVMDPFYNTYDPNYRLHADDKRGIRELYGGGSGRDGGSDPQTGAARDPLDRRQGRQEVPPQGEHCNLTFDAITRGNDGKIYAFRDRIIFRLSRNGISRRYPKPIRHVFRSAPSNIGAAVYHRRTRKTFIFKGTQFWRYTGKRKDRGYPKRLKSRFHNATAAIEWHDGRILLFSRLTYRPWSEEINSQRRSQSSPYWRGLSPGIDAALKDNDGSIYFFKNLLYWKYDRRHQRMASGYPKTISQSWLGCTRRLPK